MSSAATKEDLDNVVVVIRKDIDEVIGIVKDFMQATDQRFTGLEAEIAGLRGTVNAIGQDSVDLKASFDHLQQTIDKFISRIDGYETEQIMRDRQFEKLLDWARKVSAKTGIPLENL